MTTGPEHPETPPSGPPPAPPYGTQPYQQQPYQQQPYQQQPYQQPGYGYPVPGYAPSPPNDGLAIGAMVTGIVAPVLACGYGISLIGSPAALIMGRISMKRIDASNGQLSGRGMAQAGFILGIIGTVLLVIAIALVVVFVILAANGTFDEA